MANNELDLGVSLDLTGSQSDIQKFSKDIAGATHDLLRLAQQAQTHLAKVTADLNTAFARAKAGSKEELLAGRRIEKARAQTLGAFSQGTSMATGFNDPQFARTEAVVRNKLLQIRNEFDQASHRIAEGHLAAFTRGIRSSEAVMQARASRAQRVADDMVRREAEIAGTPGLAQAQKVRRRQNDADLIREAQVGRGQAGMEKTMARLDSNGGANLAAIQMKVLLGYQAISSTFNALKGGAGFVVQLDKEFRQFQAITATTNKEMEGLEKRLISVSEKTKFTALEVASAATIMGQAGLSAAEVATSIEAVTMLATAAGTELAPAVDLVTSTLSIFNLQTSQTADIANTMTAAINGSKLTIDKLALGFQYAGNIAAQVGITYTELTATLGALANSGIKSGSTLGTGLRQLLVDLQTPTEKFSNRLRQLGLVQADVDIKSRGLVAVLKTLKEAGFGGAEAFESFEVRAAASFVALSNNLDIVGKLERQFVLSNAAAEANAVQMESLANTFAKLQSVLGTIVYTAFKPFVEMMQDVANVTADVLSKLNRVPFLLEAVSVAFVGVGVAVTASAFSAMFRALGAGLPLFATYTAATTAMATANTVAAVSTSALSKATAGLFAVLGRHPFVLAISAVAALATAYRAFSKDVEEAYDKQKALISVLEGQLESSRNEVEAVDQTIANLIKRKSELDKDPILREAKILEVIQQFKELGGTIDASTSSVAELIEALGKIKEVDFGEQIAMLGVQIEAIATNIKLIKAQDKSKTANYSAEIGEAAMRNVPESEKARLRQLRQTQTPQEAMLEAFTTSFSGNAVIRNAAELALGTKSGDAPEIAASKAMIGTAIKSRESDILTMGMNNPSDPRIRKLESEMASLLALESLLGERLTIASDLMKNQADLSVAISKQDKASVLDAMSAMGFDQQSVRLRSDFADRALATERYIQDPTTSTTKAAEAGKALEADFEAAEAALMKRIDAWRTLFTANFPGIDPVTVDAAIQEMLTADMAEQENRVREIALKAVKDSAEVSEAAQTAYSKTLDKMISTRMKTISNSVSRDEIKATEDWIKARMDEKRDLVNGVYDEKITQELSTKGKEILELQRAEALEQINEQQAGFIDTLSDSIVKLTEKMYKEGIEKADRQIDIITDNLKDVEGEIKKARPGAMMDELIRKYNQLVGSLADALESKETLQLGLGSYDSPSSDLDAYLKKVVGAESSGNHLARNQTPGQTAAGLGGFTAGTWMGMMAKHYPEIAKQSKEKQLGLRFDPKFHMEVLKQFTKDNEAGLVGAGVPITDGSRYLAHFLGLGGAIKTMKADPSTSINDVTGADQRKANPTVFKGITTAGDLVAWVNKKMGGTAKTNTSATIQEATEARDAAVYTGTTAAVKAETAASVKATRAAIAGRTVAAGASSNADTIASNMDAIDALFDKVLADRIREFEQVNMKALASGDPEALAQLEDLKDQINTERASKLSNLVDEYGKAVENAATKPLEEARARLAEAQDPANKGKYSIPELHKLKADVDFLEREQKANAVTTAEKKLALVRAELAEATKRSGAASEEAIQWLQREAEANKELEEALRAVGLQKDAQGKSPMTQQGAFEGAVQTWQLNSGFMKLQDGIPVMLSQAEQMENVWGKVLDTMTSGFSQFFKDLASGTMTAGEAFKNFALTVIQSFMDMIAQALAFQMVQAMIKGTGGSSGWLGSLVGAVATVPGAANGELISGGIPNRDGVLRKVMPGEAILRKSAVDAIGADSLTNLNNMGNRHLSTTAPEAMSGGEGGGMVNVYVVSPDNVPPMGPNDIIATIMDDANRKGPIRQLIKSVQMGVV